MYARTSVLTILLYMIFFIPNTIFGQLTTKSSNENYIHSLDRSGFDGSFVFCRGVYENNKALQENLWVNGWFVDHPGAENNLLFRISEWTKIKIPFDSKNNPVHVDLRLNDPLIFMCPMIYLSDVGAIGLKPDEVLGLRNYLQKGGFLWVDDFWGSAGWDNWMRQFQEVLSLEFYELIDIPQDHPILHQLYDIDGVPQIPNMIFWYGTNGQTSERGLDSAEAHFRGIKNENGRLLVVITHNTDIGDTWETEIEDSKGEYIYQFGDIGYGLGINIIIYALTH